MSSGRVLRLALLLLVAALLLPVLSHSAREISDSPLEIWADRLLTGALLCFGAAIVLALLEKGGLRVAGQRCADCRRPIEHGRQYCRQHLIARVERARERHHGRPGMGI